MNAIYVVIETKKASGAFGSNGSVIVAYAPAATLSDRGNILEASGFERHEIDSEGRASRCGAIYPDDAAAEQAAKQFSQVENVDPNIYLLTHKASQWLGRSDRVFLSVTYIEKANPNAGRAPW